MAASNDGRSSAAPVMAAVCGLFCSACSFYIGTHEEPARLERMASSFHVSREALLCDGCRSERRLFYCRDCVMFGCAAHRGYYTCGECPDCPCPDLERFVAERPHRADVPRDLARIKEIGAIAWMDEATLRHSCPECGTLNPAYDLACRKCGHDPASPYVEEHRDAILARLRQDAARR
jgi:hypothetical protein